MGWTDMRRLGQQLDHKDITTKS